MFSFPVHTQSAAATNIVSMPQMMAFADKVKTASAQLLELNLQAARRLMEESQTELQKAMQVRTFADVQKLLSEQSTSSIEKLIGYWQNVGNIALETWGSPRRSVGMVEAITEPVEPSVPVSDAFMKAPAVIAKPHEADGQPSALVEKLVASVAVDAAKPRTPPKH
jgi:hypothetical protein